MHSLIGSILVGIVVVLLLHGLFADLDGIFTAIRANSAEKWRTLSVIKLLRNRWEEKGDLE